MKRKGIPIVISAASGTGKTSLCVQLLSTLSNITRSISFTTRPPRKTELHGRDYFFVTDQEFARMIDNDEFIEWAEVFGHRYGTSAKMVNTQLEEGLDVLLDIDVQGGKNMRHRIPHSLLIFLLPPSMDELRRRLVNRATDSPDAIARRLIEAKSELRSANTYDYFVVNDDFERAASDLRAIVTAARIRCAPPLDLLASLLSSE